jgi:hypothetical protein
MQSVEGPTVSEDVLAEVPFGRNRFMKWVGGGLLSVATTLVLRNAPAEAHHGAVPYPCFGFGVCHNCSGTTCTTNCSWAPGSYENCPSGGQCWNTCISSWAGNYLYRCCDWHETISGTRYNCECSEYIGGC